jgi:hypothetical protein
MEFEQYFYEVWNTFPQSIVSDEYYSKNQELLEAITFDMFQYNENTGTLGPRLASVCLQNIFSNILNFGMR